MRRLVAGLAMAAALLSGVGVAAPDAWQVGPVAASPGACSAKLPGAEIDLILMINDKGKLVLTAGHGAWNASPGSFESTLVIDGRAAGTIPVDGVGPLYLGLVPDAVTPRLRLSNSIDWTLPTGTFHIATHGLGQAMDETIACMRGK
jgi:hypothetical protein